MEKVLIVTATLDKTVSTGVSMMFQNAHELNQQQNKFRFATGIIEKVVGHAYMRNKAVQAFLETDFDRLWFVDNDVLPPNDVFTILEIDADIVSAFVPTDEMKTPYLHFKDLQNIQSLTHSPNKGNGVMDVHCVGMACTWIKRRVLEDKKMLYSPRFRHADGSWMRLEKHDAPPIFRYRWKPNGGSLFTEDFDFCYRASKLGYKVKLESDVICGHVKTVDVMEMFHATEQRVKAISA
jgi:hypothetical protein